MTIGKMCNRVVVTIPRQASAEDAARLMRSNYVGSVVVVDSPDTRIPIGILTDRDVAVNIVAQGMMPAQTLVGSVMSSPVVTVSEDDGLLSALDKMSSHGVRRAPVVDRNGRLTGLVSVDDLMTLLAREFAKVGALIRYEQVAEIQKTENSFRDELAS